MNAEQADTPFPFLKLPPELRLRVYDFAVRIPGKVWIDPRTGFPPPVTRVSRLLRAECLPVFLKNHFKVSIQDCNTAKCEAWFKLFTRYDTSKLHLEVQWIWQAPSTKERFMALLKQGFDNTSSIISRKNTSTWSTFTLARICTQDPLFDSLAKAIAVLEAAGRHQLAEWEALVDTVIEARELGEAWPGVEEKLRLKLFRLNRDAFYFDFQ